MEWKYALQNINSGRVFDILRFGDWGYCKPAYDNRCREPYDNLSI